MNIGVKASILIPERDNGGNTFPPKLWEELGNRFRETFGGFTSTGGNIGEWVDPNDGRVYSDRTFTYYVSLTSWRQVTDFIEVAQWVRTQYRQEAVLIEIAGLIEVLG